jgi:hypothetical protein
MSDDRNRQGLTAEPVQVGSMASLSDDRPGGEKHYQPEADQIARVVHQNKVEGPLPSDEVTTEDDAAKPQPPIPMQEALVSPPGPSVWEAVDDRLERDKP